LRRRDLWRASVTAGMSALRGGWYGGGMRTDLLLAGPKARRRPSRDQGGN
jgi:hypothetical protein